MVFIVAAYQNCTSNVVRLGRVIIRMNLQQKKKFLHINLCYLYIVRKYVMQEYETVMHVTSMKFPTRDC